MYKAMIRIQSKLSIMNTVTINITFSLIIPANITVIQGLLARGHKNSSSAKPGTHKLW